ncbi:MAG: PIN domain-containing protein [Opitutus sp.]|nr:PIN domain-containing protein [Opitutus sp.]
MKVFFDTSVLMAACIAEHPFHDRAAAVWLRVADRADEGFCSTHALAETYATLSVLPRSHRLHPREAHELILQNVLGQLKVVPLTTADYKLALARVVGLGLVGGVIHDALHVIAAERTQVKRIFTFHVPHFLRVADDRSRPLIQAP